MPKAKTKRAPVRPPCPECEMNMIVVSDFDRDPDKMTFECLRCGHIKKPSKNARRP